MRLVTHYIWVKYMELVNERRKFIENFVEKISEESMIQFSGEMFGGYLGTVKLKRY